jgi:hypothetical protein
MAIIEELAPRLPDGFVAEPRVHLGTFYEIDVCAFEQETDVESTSPFPPAQAGGLATATYAPPAPTLTIDADIPEQYAYEVLVFDVERERQLVAAVEIVSPANKDRPDSRQIFVAKCLSLLQKNVCVSMIDLVTIRQFNLYTELLALLDGSDPAFSPAPPPTYAVTCRKRLEGRKSKLDTWARALAVGQPLPSLPIWLTEAHTVSLDLEASYEAACRVLRIP